MTASSVGSVSLSPTCDYGASLETFQIKKSELNSPNTPKIQGFECRDRSFAYVSKKIVYRSGGVGRTAGGLVAARVYSRGPHWNF